MRDTNRSNRSASFGYLSPRALAQAIGVSESSLKRWTDEGRLAAERTAGGHRRIPLGAAVRFIREAGLTPVRPEVLGLTAAGRSAAVGDAADRLHAALLEDREAEARSLLCSLYLEGAGLGWICDVVVRGALARVGELWERGPEGVFLEHRASATCARALEEIRRLLPPVRDAAPLALGGACAGDPYRLPTAMAGLVLAEAGFRDRDLGADTPCEAVLAAIGRHRPALVWLSYSVAPADARAARRELERMAETMGAAVLVVGGRGAGAVPLPAHQGVHRLGSMSELAAFARGVAAGAPAG